MVSIFSDGIFIIRCPFLFLYFIIAHLCEYFYRFRALSNKAFPPVPTIQTVKGRVVFFRKDREKISTLKPLTVWIFAVAISPPKTGNRILQPCPRFRPLHSNGKTVCTTAAIVVSFCGATRPAPPTSPKEQNRGLMRNRAM